MSRVLIVEDDVPFREYLKDNLESAGFSVHTASTGQEAIQSAMRLKPEAMVLDLGLPDMDGRDVLKTLRLDVHTCGIAIDLPPTSGTISFHTNLRSGIPCKNTYEPSKG